MRRDEFETSTTIAGIGLFGYGAWLGPLPGQIAAGDTNYGLTTAALRGAAVAYAFVLDSRCTSRSPDNDDVEVCIPFRTILAGTVAAVWSIVDAARLPGTVDASVAQSYSVSGTFASRVGNVPGPFLLTVSGRL